MSVMRLAKDPLWQCLCPAWIQIPTRTRSTILNATTGQRPAIRCSNDSRLSPQRVIRPFGIDTRSGHAIFPNSNTSSPAEKFQIRPAIYNDNERRDRAGQRHRPPKDRSVPSDRFINELKDESNIFLYSRLHTISASGKLAKARWIVEYLLQKRGQAPNLDMYNALILANVSHDQGAAWRVTQLLEEMAVEGLQPDLTTCNAALKVLSIHTDHLLRTDILEYMAKRWWKVSDNAYHDVVAGLLREGLFEQAIDRLNRMRDDGVVIDGWLYDAAVLILCEAGEVDEAYRIMRLRMDAGERHISKSVWYALLDRASRDRHHAATSMVWMMHVNEDYLNPSSGICLNVLATAAQAGDAALGTEVFSRLSQRGTAFQRIHFELLVSTYLSTRPPDLKRALNVLTIMTLEKMEPNAGDTRALYLYLRDKPALVHAAFGMLRDLHAQERNIPIGINNVVPECLVEQHDLAGALKIYKVIHTFAPIGRGAQKSFANASTFDLLLKGCRLASPPDARTAAFLVSEMLALRVTPSAMTYDRLILVLIGAADAAVPASADSSASSPSSPPVPTDFSVSTFEPSLPHQPQAAEYLEWAFRHFIDMQSQGLMLRFGTIEALARGLSRVGDARCWDVVQAAMDAEERIEGFAEMEGWLRRNVEQEWRLFANGLATNGGDRSGDRESTTDTKAGGKRILEEKNGG